MSNENMKLWDSVKTTDKKYTKEVSFGRKYTAICAMSQVEAATKQWGSFGKTWGIKDEKFNPIETNVILYTAILFYPDGSIPVHADIDTLSQKGKYNTDWSKKVATDALTKGLSKLGFNADIFLGKFEDSKYMAMLAKFSSPAKLETEDLNNLMERVPDGVRDKFDAYIQSLGLKTTSDIRYNQFRQIAEHIKQLVKQGESK